MGLVDKILEWFQGWINLHVEDLKDDDNAAIRRNYLLAKSNVTSAEKNHEDAKKLHESDKENKEYKQQAAATDDYRKKAKKLETTAKQKYDEMVKRHNTKKSSLKQQFENVFRKNGIKREHCHGGTFNGVNCIKIMNKATAVFIGTDAEEGFLAMVLRTKLDTVSGDSIKRELLEYAKLLEILDSIWFSVRGIQGSLPTKEEQQQLSKSIKAGKTQWLKIGIGTRQPKWHMTFDGHLEEQVKRWGGIADIADDLIEKFHQVLDALRVRFKGVASYEVRESCIRRELRRQRSPEIAKEVEKYEAKTKQSAGTKRKLEALERQAAIKKAKQEKRAAVVA